MKAGRFVVDTHVHAQRFAAGEKLKAQTNKKSESNDWSNLSDVMRNLIPYDNSPRLLYDMDCYRVDMCCLLPAFGMTNEMNMQLVEEYPDKFVAVCNVDEYLNRIRDGKEEWSIEGVCKELDKFLSTGKFVGIGEQLPYMPYPYDPYKPIGPETAVKNMLAIMEVARKHKVHVRYHTGTPMGYGISYSTGSLGPGNFNPLWIHDLATHFPDVPIIVDHGGIQAWWSEKLFEDCLHVAASHDNVYLETGLWWTELYEKALIDPNIGPEKLIWGTDWGASIPFHTQLGNYPPSYAVQMRKKGVIKHQVDYWGWSLREIGRLRIAQDDMNLILGGNAAYLFNLQLPHTRLFKPRELKKNM